MAQQEEKIIEKIQNLLSLAEDGNDEESQTALLMAQKLMLKYKIQHLDLEQDQGKMTIVNKSLSIYKRVLWWEKALAHVIAENFRVMLYLQSTKLPHNTTVMRKIVFMGLEEDVAIALEAYRLAETSMRFYAKKAVAGSNDKPSDARKAYYKGFIDGLKDKFKAQREALARQSQAYALMIKVPKEVSDAFYQKVSHTKGSFSLPNIGEEDLLYSQGYNRARDLEFGQKYLKD
ncbi:TPA: DUF2786 domain-containing protein [Streptococcus suis]